MSSLSFIGAVPGTLVVSCKPGNSSNVAYKYLLVL